MWQSSTTNRTRCFGNSPSATGEGVINAQGAAADRGPLDQPPRPRGSSLTHGPGQGETSPFIARRCSAVKAGAE